MNLSQRALSIQESAIRKLDAAVNRGVAQGVGVADGKTQLVEAPLTFLLLGAVTFEAIGAEE